MNAREAPKFPQSGGTASTVESTLGLNGCVSYIYAPEGDFISTKAVSLHREDYRG